ncbi:hypothetical protein J1614_007019 [Plenodomus biglobosus]|nr:hypothetical protein J1614_007019 [Plenodomus biglobosus]
MTPLLPSTCETEDKRSGRGGSETGRMVIEMETGAWTEVVTGQFSKALGPLRNYLPDTIPNTPWLPTHLQGCSKHHSRSKQTPGIVEEQDFELKASRKRETHDEDLVDDLLFI